MTFDFIYKVKTDQLNPKKGHAMLITWHILSLY